MLVDTHCHLNHEQFHEDAAEAVSRAIIAAITRMIVVGYDLESSEAAVELACRFPSIYAAVGVHPHDATSYSAGSEAQIRDLASHPKVVAIGEIGLDYHYDFSSVDDQVNAFKAQLRLASELKLPVIIHCREAYDDTLNELESWTKQGISGVMHCWGGSSEQADRAVKMGLWLGFGGILTFKNADQTREIASSVALEKVLLETDAPYLAPVPFRGKRNEPAHVRIIAEALGKVRGFSLEEIARITTANADRLFPKLHQ